jgi:TM2 domain-containing membrane protein YozV
MYCTNCGKETEQASTSGFCAECEQKQQYAAKVPAVSQKDWLTTLLLNLFLGMFGVHRFYVGKVGTGIVWLFTAGCFGIGAIVDLILILTGKFTDISGAFILSDSQKASCGASPSKTAASDSGNYVDQLQKLAQLRDSGAITSEEYDAKKAVLLSRIG